MPTPSILLAPTPAAWVDAAVERWRELLIDHANCEKKAASTALALIFAYPEDRPLTSALSRLAREELRHFEQMQVLMEALEVTFTRQQPGRYAAELRATLRTADPERKLDLMLAGALIEARSCERFALLASRLPAPLGEFYARLQQSEARHFELYLHFAESSANGEDWRARLQVLAEHEAALITRTDPVFRFHSGVPPQAPQLPSKRYTAAQVRAMDRYLIDVADIPGYELMCRAGEAAFRLLRESWPQAKRVLVLCGGGNNGGDGYVVARLAKAASLDVRVAAIAEVAKLKGDARRAYEDCAAVGVDIRAFDEKDVADADVIVDAIFGIGLDPPLDSEVCKQIEHINASGRPVLALDMPSGLHADSGAVMGAAIRATATISFIGLKQGCFIGEGLKHSGEIHLDDLGANDIGQ